MHRLLHTPHPHLIHRWAGGWRCWRCPMWSAEYLTVQCRVFTEPSLAYVPRPRASSIHRMQPNSSAD